jgi:hypothetical protein
MTRVAPAALRTWAVRLIYASIAAHLLVGALLPWIVNSPLLEGYHHAIETAFWGAEVPPGARTLQSWWIALFGPTVQAAAVWMGALAWIGDRQRSAFAWGALAAGIALWAPQDIFISLRANCWSHVWLDGIALTGMLPPLIFLFYIDRTKRSEVAT